MGSLSGLEERLLLVTRNIPEQDVYGRDIIRDALVNQERRPRCLWGLFDFTCEGARLLTRSPATSPTGRRESRLRPSRSSTWPLTDRYSPHRVLYLDVEDSGPLEGRSRGRSS